MATLIALLLNLHLITNQQAGTITYSQAVTVAHNNGIIWETNEK